MSFDFALDPFANFRNLFKVANEKLIPDANAITLATVDPSGSPSVRVVLFKGIVRQGFSFYTNYRGRKAIEIESNPNVAAAFFWSTLEMQIRITGKAAKLTRAESEDYFRTRPRVSQIGAWASCQSEVIPSFDFLNQKTNEYEKKFLGQDVPCPDYWGGYHILPNEIEFWFGLPGRLHHRYVYVEEIAAASKNEAVNSESGKIWKRILKSP